MFKPKLQGIRYMFFRKQPLGIRMKMYKKLLKQDADKAEIIFQPTEDMKVTLVTNDPRTISYLVNPSEDLKKIALRTDPFTLYYIKNPSTDLQRIAVSKQISVFHDGYPIEYIENPSDEIKLLAVQTNPHCIRYIENPSECLQREAVSCDPSSIIYLPHASEQMMLFALEMGYEGDLDTIRQHHMHFYSS